MNSRRSRGGSSHAVIPTRTLTWRRRVLLGVWLLAGLGMLGRAAELQVAQGAEWRIEADRQHRMQGAVAAARGTIFDRDGVPLAVSHEVFGVGVAPHELQDRERTAEILSAGLDIPRGEADRIVGSDRRWVAVPGRFPPAVRETLGGVRGVYLERELRRSYLHSAIPRGLLGAVVDGAGAGGIEQQFEAHLLGVPGIEMHARDSGGTPIPGATWLVTAPRSGGEVVLTLDVNLQEIAHEALAEAIQTTRARGGDIIVTDPRTGDVLAMVSLRDGVSTHLGSINTPYEPGSTLKPFTVATLLREGKATLADSVDTGDGQWQIHGRTISDVQRVGTVTLADALQFSSNVGIAKAALALTPEEQYEAVRDFGFGVPTGVALPGEVSGTLRRPAQWSRQSAASLAIGYEISVTPMQMAMAYGALANGGVLMEPRVVRELRDERGRVIQSFGPRAVRTVISKDVADQVSRSLVGAVESGTGTRAQLASFTVAGKSGTSRMHGGTGGYEQGAYFASFAGFFPAEDPQLVVFVKLERPQGAYYGGATAAPVTRATMEAILAARKSPLDRGALAAITQARRSPPVAILSNTVVGPSVPVFAAQRDVPDFGPAFDPGDLSLPVGEVSIPDIRGMTPRSAVRRLHSLGLAVSWESTGPIVGTVPPIGTAMEPGDTIRIVVGPPGSVVPTTAAVPQPGTTGGGID